MAFPANAVWEARSAGNSTVNGAAYVPGLGGTDYSQQNNAQLVLADVVTTGGSAVITSVTGGFTSQMVGNGLSLNEGGVFSWYYIATFTSSNQVTLDKNAIGGNHTGVALRLGGGCNIGNSGVQFNAFIAPGNHIYELGSFNHNTNSPTYSTSGTAVNPIVIEGYTTTRGDGGFATHNSTTVDCFTATGNYHVIRNIKGNAGNSTVRALNAGGFACTWENCLATSSLTSAGTGAARFLVPGGNNRFYRCRTDGQTNKGYGFFINGNNNRFDHCEAYGSTELGGFTVTGSGAYFHNCISRDNTGATSDGFNINEQPVSIQQCSISKNGRDGVRLQTSSDALSSSPIEANVFNQNGQVSGYSINYSPSDISTNPGVILAALTNIKGNAFYVTGLGKSNNLPPFSGDVTLSGDPFVDSGSGHDFTLNSTTGAGQTVRDNPFQVAMPGGVGTDYHELGALGISFANAVPIAPSSMVATVISATRIDLTWADNSNDEIYFIIERSTAGGAFGFLTLAGAGVTSYSDTTCAANTVYQYRVKAVN